MSKNNLSPLQQSLLDLILKHKGLNGSFSNDDVRVWVYESEMREQPVENAKECAAALASSLSKKVSAMGGIMARKTKVGRGNRGEYSYDLRKMFVG